MQNKILEILKLGWDVAIRDMTEIGLGYGVTISKRNIGKEGFNSCVPQNYGKAIYYGSIVSFTGGSIGKALTKALEAIKKSMWG